MKNWSIITLWQLDTAVKNYRAFVPLLFFVIPGRKHTHTHMLSTCQWRPLQNRSAEYLTNRKRSIDGAASAGCFSPENRSTMSSYFSIRIEKKPTGRSAQHSPQLVLLVWLCGWRSSAQKPLPRRSRKQSANKIWTARSLCFGRIYPAKWIRRRSSALRSSWHNKQEPDPLPAIISPSPAHPGGRILKL